MNKLNSLASKYAIGDLMAHIPVSHTVPYAEGGKVDMLRRGLLKGLAGLTAAGVAGEKVLPKTGLQAAEVPKMTAEHLAAPAAVQHIPPGSSGYAADDLHEALRHMDIENEGTDANIDHVLGILRESPARNHPLVGPVVDHLERAADDTSGVTDGTVHFGHVQDLDKALLDISPGHHADLHGGEVGQWYDSPAHEGAMVRSARTGKELGNFSHTDDNQVWHFDDNGFEVWKYPHEVAPPDRADLLKPDDGP